MSPGVLYVVGRARRDRLGPGEPHESAADAADGFPWEEILDTLTPTGTLKPPPPPRASAAHGGSWR